MTARTPTTTSSPAKSEPKRVTGDEARALLAKAQGQQPESVVIGQVRDYLKALGWDVTRHQQGLGSRRGFPDLTALKDGRTVYVECKATKGKQSEHQRTFQATCEAHGGTYLLVRSLDELIEHLRGTT